MPIELDQEGAGKVEGFLTVIFEPEITFLGNSQQSTGGTLKEDA